jgi:hypothetical protein
VWVEAVQVRGAENPEVYLTFSPRFERIWLESKRRLPEYVAEKPANIGLRSQTRARNGKPIGTRRGRCSNSRLWIELRWSIKRKLFTALRSNARDEGAVWITLDPPVLNHAVAKRKCFEMIAFTTVPITADV